MSGNFNGNHLLSVFNELDVDLGNLNPNVVRAWYDTDDFDTLNFLNFLCELSGKNTLKLLEFEEYKKCDKNINLSGNFSEIFNHELNCELHKVASVELEQLKNEERKLDELLRISGNLERTIGKEESELNENDTILEFQNEELTLKCKELCGVLDKKHEEIHVKLSKISSELGCGNFSDLFHEKSFESFPIFDEDILKISNQYEFSIECDFNSTPNHENVLETFRNDLNKSYRKFLSLNLEVQCLKAISNYLKNFKEKIREEQIPLKNTISMEKLIELSSKNVISKIRKNERRNEIERLKNNLECFRKISNYFDDFLCIAKIFRDFLVEDHKNITISIEFLKDISKYTLNLRNLQERNNLMSEWKKRDKLNKLVEILTKNQNLRFTEKKYFEELNGIVENSFGENSMEIFLNSGATRKLKIVPIRLTKTLKSIESNLKNQEDGLKFLIKIYGKTLDKLRGQDKLTKNLRLLWIYFLVEPSRKNQKE